MPSTPLLVFTTCPDARTARTLARTLVERRLAACVNLLPGALSIYRWKDAIEEEAEVVLLVKTTADRYPELERTLGELHPYELPECMAVSIEHGATPYLQWIEQCTRPDPV